MVRRKCEALHTTRRYNWLTHFDDQRFTATAQMTRCIPCMMCVARW